MLANNTQLRHLGSLSPQANGNAGRRVTLPNFKNVKTLAWHVKVIGQLQISVAAATAILDTGSILSVFDECGINDGQDRMPSNPLDMRFVSELFAKKPLPATRAASTAIGTYQLSESFTIFASYPHGAVPEEVSFIERNPLGDYFFYIKQTANADGGASRLVTPGGATVAVTNVVVTVRQEYVAMGGQLPIFQPRIEQDVIQISGTNAALPKNFLKNYYLQGMLWRQDISGGPRVGDIVSAFRLSGTNRDFIGPEMVASDEYQQYVNQEAGGNVYTIGAANPYLPFWFQRNGRLGKIIRPNDPNFKATLSVANSVTAGTSEVQVTYFLLDRDNTVRPDGTRVTKSDAELAKTGLRI